MPPQGVTELWPNKPTGVRLSHQGSNSCGTIPVLTATRNGAQCLNVSRFLVDGTAGEQLQRTLPAMAAPQATTDCWGNREATRKRKQLALPFAPCNHKNKEQEADLSLMSEAVPTAGLHTQHNTGIHNKKGGW